ncbi:MAG TPA: hypothetical protein VM183_06790 [Burkholderiales bacterium]|nr:hypothetical protein [Burkholderiales bacterium]
MAREERYQPAQSKHRPIEAAAALRRNTTASTTRLVILGDDNGRAEPLLASLGYQILAKAQNAEQAIALTADLRPDGVIVVLDSPDRASALFAIRVLNHRYTCAVIVLATQLDRTTLTQLKLATPHAVLPLPVANEILDAVVHSALDAAAQRAAARHAKLKSGAASGPVPAGFDAYFNLAVGRALRHGTTFAAGAVAFLADELDAERLKEVGARASERLRNHLRGHDVVQHRADGTLVFLAEDVGAHELEALGERILRALTRSSGAQEEQPQAWPAIGLALWSAGHDHHGVLHAAEDAMAHAREAGGACWRVALLDGSVGATRAHGGDTDGTPSEPPPRRMAFIVLQRMIGWTSLGVLLWVVANYAGFSAPDVFEAHTQRFVSFLTSFHLSLR